MWVVASYNHIILTARTMIRYDWNGLATPAWGSQTEVEYQLVVGTGMGVPTISPECQLVPPVVYKIRSIELQVDSPNACEWDSGEGLGWGCFY